MDKETKIQAGDDSRGKGTLYVIGIGPGSLDHLTPKAKEAISAASVVVGYGRYLDLIAPLTEGKEIFRDPDEGRGRALR